MEFKDKAIEYAEDLCHRRRGKENVVNYNLRRILEEYQIEHYAEHPAGNGRVDIYLPRHRLVIETKAPGAVSLENKSQVDRYVKYLASEEGQLLHFDGKNPPSFTGVLTDGRTWYAWKYHHALGRELEQILDRFTPIDGRSLLKNLITLWHGKIFGKPGIDANPKEHFKAWLNELRDIYQYLSGERRTHTNTKISLWLDMLRTSSMAPQRKYDQEHLFVAHTFLVALARGVIHAVVKPNDEPNSKDLLGDGFIAWVLDSTKGKKWADDFLQEINKWDWTRRTGDVLRPLYEAFVEEKDRKSFGEFYTPDWLAQFMIEEVLDDDWCAASITSALRSETDSRALDGVGVLDPACGSGTFLYFAAQRLMKSHAMAKQGLTAAEKSNVVAKLVNGIDVHPVAAEMARATIMRALRWEPGEGIRSLRIYEGDSLQLRSHEDSLFTPGPDEVVFESPQGDKILLPHAFLYRTDFAKSVRRLVETAVQGNDCPDDIIASSQPEDRDKIREAHKSLVKIIHREGNSVWTWYIVNMSGPYQLSQRKIDRIVANPPWVSMAGIQDETRKRALEAFAQNKSGIWSGGKNAPHFDIAQLFVKRCREMYLMEKEHNPSAWLVKLAALTSGGWQKFREKHGNILKQSIDLMAAQPFGGGDARRCCVLLECREARSISEICHTPKAIAKLVTPRRRPEPHMTWQDASLLLSFEAAPRPFPVSPSEYYKKRFRQGATITPMVLTLVDKVIDETENQCTITTVVSQKSPWNELPPQKGTFQKTWIRRTLKSQRLLPFIVHPELHQTIVPTGSNGLYIHSTPSRKSQSWHSLDEIYREYRGRGISTPKTLIEQIDYQKKITHQLNNNSDQLTKVVYPASADIMRAARMIHNKAIVDSSVYWYIAENEEESAYLVGVLNASVLTEAFSESRTSGRTFHKNPWRKIPIPRYNKDDTIHKNIVKLTLRAEDLAATVLANREKMGGGKLGFPGVSGNCWITRVLWTRSIN